MLSNVWRNVWATRIFFLVRFIASFVVGVVYLLVAAGIQYLFVSWFGENTFNYILGGVMSLVLGAWACNYLGRLLFMFIRGWHMGALAYSKKIVKKHMPALDVGMTVMSRHLTSFAMVYGASALVGKYVNQGVEKLWKLLDDVPYLGTLAHLSDNIVVRHIASDILDTGFDACIYYLVKYTEPGVGDDLQNIPDAMRRYLYALPSVMLASLTSFVLLYFVPRVIKWIAIVMMILSQGLVAGILINVLMFPVFYLLEHSIFDPLETIILISAYAKKCKEEIPEDSPIKSLVDEILEGLGVGELGDNSCSPVERIKRKAKQAIGMEEDEESAEEAEPVEEKPVTKKRATVMKTELVDSAESATEAEAGIPSSLAQAMARAGAGSRVRVEDIPEVEQGDVSDYPDVDESDESVGSLGGLASRYTRQRRVVEVSQPGDTESRRPASLADVLNSVSADELAKVTRPAGIENMPVDGLSEDGDAEEAVTIEEVGDEPTGGLAGVAGMMGGIDPRVFGGMDDDDDDNDSASGLRGDPIEYI